MPRHLPSHLVSPELRMVYMVAYRLPVPLPLTLLAGRVNPNNPEAAEKEVYVTSRRKG